MNGDLCTLGIVAHDMSKECRVVCMRDSRTILNAAAARRC